MNLRNYFPVAVLADGFRSEPAEFPPVAPAFVAPVVTVPVVFEGAAPLTLEFTPL